MWKAIDGAEADERRQREGGRRGGGRQTAVDADGGQDIWECYNGKPSEGGAVSGQNRWRKQRAQTRGAAVSGRLRQPGAAEHQPTLTGSVVRGADTLNNIHTHYKRIGSILWSADVHNNPAYVPNFTRRIAAQPKRGNSDRSSHHSPFQFRFAST